MRLCYVDESLVPGADEWFYLGGVVLPIEDALRLDDEIEAALELDWREDIQMDTLKDLRRGNTFSVERRRELSRDLYEHLNDTLDYRVCCTILHQDSLESITGEVPIYMQAFKLLMERFQWQLIRGGEEDYGIVYIDSRDSDGDIQEAHHRLQQSGSSFVDFENIVGVSAPIRDEFSRGIQLADLIVAGIRAHFQDLTSRYYQYICPHLDRHPRSGEILGTGIKVFPDEGVEHLEYHPNQTSF